MKSMFLDDMSDQRPRIVCLRWARIGLYDYRRPYKTSRTNKVFVICSELYLCVLSGTQSKLSIVADKQYVLHWTASIIILMLARTSKLC